LDPTLFFHHHCIMLISRIWTGHASLRDKLQSFRTPSATLLFRLWQRRVAVHLPSHLALLSKPGQTTSLQSPLDLSLSYNFRVPPVSLTLLKLDLGLPPLDLLTQAALARLDCRLQVLPPDHLCNETSTRLYAGGLSARRGTTKPTITTESKTLHSHERTC